MMEQPSTPSFLENVFNSTNATGNFGNVVSGGKILLGICMFSVIIVSFTANLFVIVTFIIEKKLRNSFTVLVVNLAVTDLLINVIAMDFYTINIIFEYWPFGKVLCGVWVFFDYTTVFSSSWSLAAISIDRYWSIRWSVYYRNLKGYKKPAIMISVVWISVAAIVWYPVISDRILRTEEYVCVYEASENPEFVIVLAIFGHHTPCIIIVVMTVLVYVEIRKLAKVKPGGAVHSTPSQGMSEGRVRTSHSEDDSSSPVTRGLESNREALDKRNDKGCFKICRKLAPLRAKSGISRSGTKMDKERKAFLTLAHIVFCYVMTWVPFHVIYDISIVMSNSYAVSKAFEYLFWLTYVNSAINPFLYAYTSPELRASFKKLISCCYIKK